MRPLNPLCTLGGECCAGSRSIGGDPEAHRGHAHRLMSHSSIVAKPNLSHSFIHLFIFGDEYGVKSFFSNLAISKEEAPQLPK